MVHWIYVLECEDDYIYVGQTTRLYRRFNEHLAGNGSINTHRHTPQKLVGLYKVSDNYSFLKYRTHIKNNEYNKFLIRDWGDDEESGKLEIENHITERYLYERKENDCPGGGFEWYKVRGGKYTRENCTRNPVDSINHEDIVDRPLCDHNYPSEVKISKDKKTIYFVCSLKNMWADFYNYILVESPCNFYKIYDEDVYIKKQYEINNVRLGEPFFLNIPIVKTTQDVCVICKKTNYTPIYTYSYKRRLCQSCLSNKYDEIKNTYSINTNKCLIVED
jgi:putative endonuclease